MDEGHAFARGHAAIHCVPPALALAEAHGVSGREALIALVLGYEVAARAGVATKLRRGVHPFGAWGVLGAAAVGARFAGLEASGVAGVLEVAASYAITPSFESAYQGANVRNT
jgi:2-methylcitrate dehydratase PrpD